MHVTEVTARTILTRTGGYLKSVCSHSLQPYRGCSFGNALCGTYCYVAHNAWVTAGREWGSFLEVKRNAAERYRAQYAAERSWARRARGGFSVFLSSSTDPFVPHEDRYGVTGAVLAAMCEMPPDRLILQTHSHRVASAREVLMELAGSTDLRVHVTVEGDRDRLPGLPPPASSVDARFAAMRELSDAGLHVVATVSPLFPLADPEGFFARIAESASACVIDHFIGGDGTKDGGRTRRTPFPAAMARVAPDSVTLDYRDRMVAVAERHLPGRAGVGPDGFAGEATCCR